MPFSAACGTAARITRSRNRRNRSSANRRGSWPISMILSMLRNTPAASPAAKASTISSSSASGVNPSSAAAWSWETPSGPAPPSSWSSTDRESRTDPPPARTTSGRADGSTATPSVAQIPDRYSPSRRGGTRRNG